MIPRPDDILTVRSQRLHIEECSVEALAAHYGTPLFVLSETQLRTNARRFRHAFGSAWPGPAAQVLPAIKANFVLAVRHILTQEGLGCDTFGAGEFHAAVSTGVPPELISVNGATKEVELIKAAIEHGACITLDSSREAAIVSEQARALGRRARVRVRARPDFTSLVESSDFDERGGSVAELAARYKPGIPRNELVEVTRRLLARDEIDLTGMMMHIGRHRRDLTFWRKVMVSFAAVVAQLVAETGWEPRELDIGGGFATARDPTGRRDAGASSEGRAQLAPTIEGYAEAICETLAAELRRHRIDPATMTLLLEPGRGLLSDTGIHVVSVSHVKIETAPRLRRWVETDTSEMFLPDALRERYSLVPLQADTATSGDAVLVDLVGKSCEFDILAGDVEMQLPNEGDVLAFVDTGAYLETSGSNFNAMPRPGTVLVRGADHELVKRPETVEDVFARDLIPARLRTETRTGIAASPQYSR